MNKNNPESYQKIHIIPIGDYSVGKSNISNVFFHKQMSSPHHPCAGIDFILKTITIDCKLLKLLIWETHGIERFGGLYPCLYRQANGILLVYDITNRQSFDNLKEYWYKEVSQHSNTETECILVGNKCDLESERAVDVSLAKEFADSVSIPFIETSATEDINVEKAFVLIAAAVLKKLPERNDNIILAGSSRESQSYKCSC